MKYTLDGFSQEKAIELGLDSTDLRLLRYFIDFKDSGEMVKEIIEGDVYYWVKYDAVIEQLPILKITKRTIMSRFQNMATKEILKSYTKRQGGTFSFYAVGNKYKYLVSNNLNKEGYLSEKTGVSVETNRGVRFNGQGVSVKTDMGVSLDRHQNINLLKNKSIKNITLLEDREQSSEPSLSDSDDRVRKIIKETLDSMSNIAYDMWFKDTIIEEYENKVSIAVSKELLRYVPSKYKKQIEIPLDKPIELIEKI